MCTCFVVCARNTAAWPAEFPPPTTITSLPPHNCASTKVAPWYCGVLFGLYRLKGEFHWPTFGNYQIFFKLQLVREPPNPYRQRPYICMMISKYHMYLL